jgi:hypothetical protein
LFARIAIAAFFSALLALLPGLARADGVELAHLATQRVDDGLELSFTARFELSRPAEDALHKGVPLYFVAEAAVLRSRWYWRDERIARIARTWRLSYQPLTATWRISLGGLSQSFPTLSEALAPMSRVSGWRLVEAEKLDPGERYYVEFSFQLDNSQLPRPMQLDLAAQADWQLSVERKMKLE